MKKKKTPSSGRYDKNNPVVSFRALEKDREIYLEVKQKQGVSHGDIYRAGLGIFHKKMKDEDKIRQEAFDEGMEYGIEAIEAIYAVKYPCGKCGKEMIVETEEEKKVIRKFMMDNEWGHAECPKKRRQR